MLKTEDPWVLEAKAELPSLENQRHRRSLGGMASPRAGFMHQAELLEAQPLLTVTEKPLRTLFSGAQHYLLRWLNQSVRCY